MSSENEGTACEAGSAPARYHIGEFANRVQLSHRTIRHYDDLGIVKPSGRTAGNFRVYTDADVRRFLLIKPFKPLGIGLDEVKALVDALDVMESATASGSDIERARDTVRGTIERIAERRAEVEEAINASSSTVRELRAVVATNGTTERPRWRCAPVPGSEDGPSSASI